MKWSKEFQMTQDEPKYFLTKFAVPSKDMGEVVDIDALRPHMTGPVVCLSCKKKWVAVALVGSLDLECPDCGLFKGVWEGVVRPKEWWQCKCGCCHFFVNIDGCHCAHCGVVQSF